jgi:GTPase SAR1 family protein
MQVDGISYKVDIVDTAGQDDFKGLMDSWIRNSDGKNLFFQLFQGFIFCYDVTSQLSLAEVQNIIKLTYKHKDSEPSVAGNPFIPSVLVGCKCDVKEELYQVSKKDAMKVGQQLLFVDTSPEEDVPYFFETSAKKNVNVMESFESVLKQHVRKNKYMENLISKKSTGKKKTKPLFSSISRREDLDDELDLK